jgi:hypothetical protein
MGLKIVLSTKNTGKIPRKRSQIKSILHFGSVEAQNGKKEVWLGKVNYGEIYPHQNWQDFRAFYPTLPWWFLTHDYNFLKSVHCSPIASFEPSPTLTVILCYLVGKLLL